MVRFLLVAFVVLLIPAAGVCGHRAGLFGRVVVKDKVKHVERERGAAFQAQPVRGVIRGIVGGGCVGAVRGAGCAGTVGAGCSGWTGPSLPVPPVAPVPAPMPKK